jgi:hypothetical protein
LFANFFMGRCKLEPNYDMYKQYKTKHCKRKRRPLVPTSAKEDSHLKIRNRMKTKVKESSGSCNLKQVQLFVYFAGSSCPLFVCVPVTATVEDVMSLAYKKLYGESPIQGCSLLYCSCKVRMYQT